MKCFDNGVSKRGNATHAEILRPCTIMRAAISASKQMFSARQPIKEGERKILWADNERMERKHK